MNRSLEKIRQAVLITTRLDETYKNNESLLYFKILNVSCNLIIIVFF